MGYIQASKGDYVGIASGTELTGFSICAYNSVELITDNTRMYWYADENGDLRRERLTWREAKKKGRSQMKSPPLVQTAVRELVEAVYYANTKA